MTQGYYEALLGGALIGMASGVLLILNGRIAGICGIFKGSIIPLESTSWWRMAFLLGLVLGGTFIQMYFPERLPEEGVRPFLTVALGGLFVGLGTTWANGCTSGHGVCGIGRLSMRSVVATVIFITSGVLTVTVYHALFGGIT
jgi:hypothetical protein